MHAPSKFRLKSIRSIVATLGLAVAGFAVDPVAEENVFESPLAPIAATPLDELVRTQLAPLKVQPVLCSDAVFVRRAHLDVIGMLPTAHEARAFIQDPDTANKRRLLIDRLLQRDEFADYWAMKWGDVLRIKAEFPVNLWPNAAQAYHRWVRTALATNLPYDRFARELLTASGSNFRVGPVNFYRAIQDRKPEGIATAVALTFMGTRADAWPAERRAGVAAFFSQVGYKPTSEWKEEHVFWDPLGTSAAPGTAAPGRADIPAIAKALAEPSPKALPTGPRSAPQQGIFPDGKVVALTSATDPREVFADWLITPENPWFTRAIANRVWAWLLGRGIVHEPDDIRPDNPPSNSALLDYLARELVAARYDLKQLYRLILNSRTYQSSAMPRFKSRAAEANFAAYPLRRLDAEVLIDAINAITGATDLYTSAIPEPFTYIPEGKPAVAIADGSITSPFLALFGRSARATGMANERDNKPVPAQWLHLLNSSHIQRKIEQGPKLRALIEPGRGATAITEDLYLTILSRFPTPAERNIIAALGQIPPVKSVPAAKGAAAANPAAPAPKAAPVKRREDWLDVAWALINSSEFLYRH